jgi:hypothetical protein
VPDVAIVRPTSVDSSEKTVGEHTSYGTLSLAAVFGLMSAASAVVAQGAASKSPPAKTGVTLSPTAWGDPDLRAS